MKHNLRRDAKAILMAALAAADPTAAADQACCGRVTIWIGTRMNFCGWRREGRRHDGAGSGTVSGHPD